mgnify:CR=1 FL=1
MNTNMQTFSNNLEMFSLVWLATNDDLKDSRDTQEKLRCIINQLRIFEHPQEFQYYIEQKTKENLLVLIINGQLGRSIIDIIHRQSHVLSIYVYSIDTNENQQWTSQFRKVNTFSLLCFFSY